MFEDIFPPFVDTLAHLEAKDREQVVVCGRSGLGHAQLFGCKSFEGMGRAGDIIKGLFRKILIPKLPFIKII